MSIGSMSTLDALQTFYQLQMMAAQQPYIGQTVSGLNEMGQTPINNFQGIPDFNRYMQQKYVDPAMYQLDSKLKDLAHTKEYFSSGYQNRVAQAKADTNMQLQQATAEEMMGQREGRMSGMESALMRQMKALQQFNTMTGNPLSVQGQENTVRAKGLFG